MELAVVITNGMPPYTIASVRRKKPNHRHTDPPSRLHLCHTSAQVNQAWSDLSGYSATEAVGRTSRMLQGSETSVDVLAYLHAALAEYRSCTVALINYHRSGAAFAVELTVEPIRDAAGSVINFRGSLRRCHPTIAKRASTAAWTRRNTAVLSQTPEGLPLSSSAPSGRYTDSYPRLSDALRGSAGGGAPDGSSLGSSAKRSRSSDYQMTSNLPVDTLCCNPTAPVLLRMMQLNTCAQNAASSAGGALPSPATLPGGPNLPSCTSYGAGGAQSAAAPPLPPQVGAVASQFRNPTPCAGVFPFPYPPPAASHLTQQAAAHAQAPDAPQPSPPLPQPHAAPPLPQPHAAPPLPQPQPNTAAPLSQPNAARPQPNHGAPPSQHPLGSGATIVTDPPGSGALDLQRRLTGSGRLTGNRFSAYAGEQQPMMPSPQHPAAAQHLGAPQQQHLGAPPQQHLGAPPPQQQLAPQEQQEQWHPAHHPQLLQQFSPQLGPFSARGAVVQAPSAVNGAAGCAQGVLSSCGGAGPAPMPHLVPAHLAPSHYHHHVEQQQQLPWEAMRGAVAPAPAMAPVSAMAPNTQHPSHPGHGHGHNHGFYAAVAGQGVLSIPQTGDSYCNSCHASAAAWGVVPSDDSDNTSRAGSASTSTESAQPTGRMASRDLDSHALATSVFGGRELASPLGSPSSSPDEQHQSVDDLLMTLGTLEPLIDKHTELFQALIDLPDNT